jgi:hypothetical protein
MCRRGKTYAEQDPHAPLLQRRVRLPLQETDTTSESETLEELVEDWGQKKGSSISQRTRDQERGTLLTDGDEERLPLVSS